MPTTFHFDSKCSQILLVRTGLFLLSVMVFLGCEKTKETPDSPQTTAVQFDDATEQLHSRGVALMGQFDYAAAHDVFADLAAKHSGWADFQVDLAIAKLNRRQGDDANDAADILESAIEGDPQNLRAKYCRAILLFYNGQIERARSLFQEVSDADPNDGYAAYFTGQCLFDLGQFDAALQMFFKAQECDPYLRSAYYGAFQTYQRLSDRQSATEQLGVFEKLADNPQARSAEIKYSRMGPKAEAQALVTNRPQEKKPTGELFQTPTSFQLELPEGFLWTEFDSDERQRFGTTLSDINGDERLDLFIHGALTDAAGQRRNAVILQLESGWQLAVEHPLANVPDVLAAVWGDLDNDGRVDAFFCCEGEDQLWRQSAGEGWARAELGLDLSTSATVDAACFDADHDGDLDLFLLGVDGIELLNNNLDGTFRAIADQQQIASAGKRSQGVVVGDLDRDRDADIFVIRESAPHALFLNDRLWNYTDASTLESRDYDALLSSEIDAAVAVDTDADGQLEIVTANSEGIRLWTPDSTGQWQAVVLSEVSLSAPIVMAAQDFDGDGRPEILVDDAEQVRLCNLDGEPIDLGFGQDRTSTTGPIALAAIDPDQGPSLAYATSAEPPQIVAPGAGRFEFVAIEFSGQASKADQMRSNASGIGVQAAARIAGRWSAMQTFRDQSGPGQSRQPLLVGLGGASSIDYVHLVWPDGLFQTELQLTSGKTIRIEETQRQVSSCPVVFVWDGKRCRFVSDVLGVGGLGFNHGRGEYHAARPHERLLLPPGLPVALDGKYVVKIGEPMEESCYLDAAALVAYDIPEGWELLLDERQAVNDPQPTGEAMLFQSTITPAAIVDIDGASAMEALSLADGVPLTPGRRDRRFLARTEPFSFTLEFAQPLQSIDLSDGGRFVMLIDGWIEYPYSQTMFAAWQAGADYRAPTLSARSADGTWHTVYEQFGYPAGMPRQMCLPIALETLPEETTALRVTTNMEIYWDRVALVVAKPIDGVRTHRCQLAGATLQDVGFPQRTATSYGAPHYEYELRAPLWDTRHHPGFYTLLGEVIPLVSELDDAVAVFGPGEEIELKFIDRLPPVAEGKRRRFVLEFFGWCKDMDLYTRDGETLGPLPRRKPSDEPAQSALTQPSGSDQRDKLHERYHRRFRAG